MSIRRAGAFHIDRPLLRGANADLNMTSAMAVIFFVLWLIWALQANGIGGFLMHLFGPKGETSGVLKILMVVVFFLVGWLEIISILFRPVSLSFRLFGNIYAGESILDAMSHMVPALGLADSNSVLLFGNPGGVRPGAGLYVIDRCFHALDCATRVPGRKRIEISAIAESKSPKT